jgi:hypothetical protein
VSRLSLSLSRSNVLLSLESRSASGALRQASVDLLSDSRRRTATSEHQPYCTIWL